MQKLWVSTVAAMTAWHQGKVFVENAVAIGHDSLHVIVGVLVLLIFGLISGRPLSSWVPWLWLLVVIFWNETVDLWTEQWPDAGQQYREGGKDVVITMLLPTILLIAIRAKPALFRSPAGRRER